MTNRLAPSFRSEFPDRTIFNGGVEAEDSTLVAARFLSNTQQRGWVHVLWLGNANRLAQYGDKRLSAPHQIKADLALVVDCLRATHSRFVVMSVLHSAHARRGTTDYQRITALNAELATLYPDNYFDARSYLVGLYDPDVAQDVIDFQNDVPPSSIRIDDMHLTEEGYRALARRVRRFILEKSW